MKQNLDKQKKKITDFFEAIDLLFQINNFSKTIICKEQDDEKKCAEIFLDIPYQTIEISIYPVFFRRTQKEQRKDLLHELCHCITLPTKIALHDLLSGKLIPSHILQNINEEATSKIENILDGLLQGRFKYATKAYSDYLKK